MRIIFNCVGIKPLFYAKGGAIQKLVGYQVDNLKRENQIIIVGQSTKKIKDIKVIQEKKFYNLTVFNFIWISILGFLKSISTEGEGTDLGLPDSRLKVTA